MIDHLFKGLEFLVGNSKFSFCKNAKLFSALSYQILISKNRFQLFECFSQKYHFSSLPMFIDSKKNSYWESPHSVVVTQIFFSNRRSCVEQRRLLNLWGYNSLRPKSIIYFIPGFLDWIIIFLFNVQGFYQQIGPPTDIYIQVTSEGYMVIWKPPKHGQEMLKYYSVVWSKEPSNEQIGAVQTLTTSFTSMLNSLLG